MFLPTCISAYAEKCILSIASLHEHVKYAVHQAAKLSAQPRHECLLLLWPSQQAAAVPL